MTMIRPSKAELVDAIAVATRAAAASLFREFSAEHFYYFALVTTGEALAPNVTAWSTEALDVAVNSCGNDPNAAAELKWSNADSPYYCYGEQYFDDVRRMFDMIGRTDASDAAMWAAAYAFKMDAMEAAMSRLDQDGLFGRGHQRSGIVINVECMPPDHTNVERAVRLNPQEALTEWLKEAAEFV
jgi:Domain of unknown function (DUF4303)